MESTKPSPIPQADRILSLDVLRGFAVLGILIMNIQSFSMIEAAYLNPTAYGDLTGLNKWVWIVSHMLADSKFMSLFSMLFGAGILLFTSRIEAKNLKPARFYYRRSFWLLVIGLLHAYLLWYGDILVTYAICSLVLFFFRNLSARRQIIIGCTFVVIPSLLYLFFAWSMSFWPPESLQFSMNSWKPAIDMINLELSAYQDSWIDQFQHRIPAAQFLQTQYFLMNHGWRAGGLMLIGMALYKWKVLTAGRSNAFYIRMAVIGLVTGYLVVGTGILQNFRNHWVFEYSMFTGVQFNYWGSIAVALGYIGVIMLIFKAFQKHWLVNALAKTGQSALTNYLGQTIICTLIFYGHGLGLYGTVERRGQILIILLIWFVQLTVSSLWFRYFRFGPGEWIWRTLTYFRIQPFRRTPQ